MDVEPLPTVEQLTAWMRVGGDAIKAAEAVADLAFLARQAVSAIYTTAPVGVYLKESSVGVRPDTNGAGGGYASPHDCLLVKTALAQWLGIAAEDLTGVPTELGWVKVAFSPTVRDVGESLNFFPGTYPGGIPNSPSPVASMLTSGLVGAGLGYGTGMLAEKLLPRSWRQGRLRKTLGIVGGLAGVAPGAVWGMVNKGMGRDFNDSSLLDHAAGAEPSMALPDMAPLAGIKLGSDYTRAMAAVASSLFDDTDAFHKEAFDSGADDDGFARQMPKGPLGVDIDAMGRTLWSTGASPQLAGMTMGALAAAQQMPGGEEPGFVTPGQMANLAAHMGAGYLSGALVGTTLGLLTGMPPSTQETLRRTGMYMGIVRAVVPRLFGQ